MVQDSAYVKLENLEATELCPLHVTSPCTAGTITV